MNPSQGETDVPKSIGSGLSKLGLLLRHHAWKEAGGRGLTPTQGQILAFLQTRPERCSTGGKIAEALAVTPPTITDAVNSLVAKGLVSKERSAADARVVEIRLTEEGTVQAQSTMAWPDFLTPALGALSPTEQGDFLRSLVVMIRELQEQGQIPVTHMCPTCTYFRPHAHPGAARPHHCALVDGPIGDRDLRLDCAEHEPAAPDQAIATWHRFRQPQ